MNCEYPLFREQFLAASTWNQVDLASTQNQDAVNSPQPARGRSFRAARSSDGSGRLDSLDLRQLNRVDEPEELVARRAKLEFYDKQCSKVLTGLYFGSEHIAKNYEILQQHGITHVINCVGSLYPEFFAGKLQYLTLYLKDAPQEDILCVFNDCFDFIERARRSGGHVLVHCSQGVSRSATIVIAYAMWKLHQSYEAVFGHVKKIRGVANPNIGFTCALMYWHKRRSTAVKRCRMFRLAPHCLEAPSYIVPKGISHPCASALDSRGVFLIHTPGKLYLWVGSQADAAYVAAAQPIASRICRYDGVGAVPIISVAEGHEPGDLVHALTSEDTGADSLGGGITHAAAPFVPFPHLNADYTDEYLMLRSAGVPGHSRAVLSGADSSSLTPRSTTSTMSSLQRARHSSPDEGVDSLP